jgi:23S rRNA (guanosine2251-2'-O)-methyltransferase
MSKVKNEKNSVVGIHAVTALLTQSPEKIRALYLSEHRHDEKFSKIIALSKKYNIPIERQSHLFEKELHTQGVIAICAESDDSYSEISLPELLSNLDKPPLLLILDGVQDPHNLGACLRTANAAGVDALIIPKDRAAPLNATAKKVASGAAEFTPVITVTNLVRTLDFLKEKGIWIYGLAEDGSKSIYAENFKHPTAFVLGAEGEGLRRLTKENCDVLLSIPMMGQIESLNVSVATGVCLYEARRQRSLP